MCALTPVAISISMPPAIIEESGGPLLSLNINLKISITDLLNALDNWKSKVDADASVVPAVHVPPIFTPCANVTWNTDIRDLKTRAHNQHFQWNATNFPNPKYILQDESLLNDIEVIRCRLASSVAIRPMPKCSGAELIVACQRGEDAFADAKKKMAVDLQKPEATLELEKTMKVLDPGAAILLCETGVPDIAETQESVCATSKDRQPKADPAAKEIPGKECKQQ